MRTASQMENDRSLELFQISGSLTTSCRRNPPNFRASLQEPQLVVQEIEVRQLCRILRPVGPGYVVAVAETLVSCGELLG